MKRLNLVCLLLMALYLSCSSKIAPQYAFVEPGVESPAVAGKGLPVEGGWEFQFPETLNIQKVAVNYEGLLSQLTLHYKTDGRWEHVNSMDAQASSPLVIDLNVGTDAIRLFASFSGRGRITFCQFYIGKKQKYFSIPLEKPPFIK